MSGITDEAAIEGHDLIHNAEVEEERLHPDMPGKKQAKEAPGGPAGDNKTGGRESTTLDKVKEALHLKK
ncbi:hypothetical protein XA68_13342 [Ophiocordyceps unilateralis]|uniref:Uncharacterized protein n=1 Tax=Ophiocordyceps unilateralis TaxID=268505 RepID=A0A2A9PCP0_OPHUN|nr:hypothetical protein XA68_13342 [Ophiocordyceps unilateralis]